MCLGGYRSIELQQHATVATRLWRVRGNAPRGRAYKKVHDSPEKRILLRAGFI